MVNYCDNNIYYESKYSSTVVTVLGSDITKISLITPTVNVMLVIQRCLRAVLLQS